MKDYPVVFTRPTKGSYNQTLTVANQPKVVLTLPTKGNYNELAK